MYLRQVRQTRVLGLVGYLPFGVGYLLMLSTEVVAAFVLPALARSSPIYVNNVVVAAFGGTPPAASAGCGFCSSSPGLAYMGGGLLFGIALFRARVLARWAAAHLPRRPAPRPVDITLRRSVAGQCRPTLRARSGTAWRAVTRGRGIAAACSTERFAGLRASSSSRRGPTRRRSHHKTLGSSRRPYGVS